MAISDKLNYLIETKQLFKDRLNSLGAEITSSTTFRNYLNWLDTFYNEVSDKTDLSQNGVVGRTSQETTTGKNLFGDTLEVGTINSSGNNSTSTDNMRNADYISVNQQTTYTISTSTNCYIGIRYYNSSKTFLSSGTTAEQPNTFTTPANCKYVRFVFVNITDTTINTQLEEGTQATPYEEYTGGIPSPNPDYPQPINNLSGDVPYKVSGKNLLDTTKMVQFTPSSSTWYSVDGIDRFYNTTQIIKSNVYYDLKANTTYTFSVYSTLNKNTSIGSPIQLVDKSGRVIIFMSQNNTYMTFTTTEDIRVYPRMSVQSDNVLTQCIVQLEENSTATDYEPYIESQTFNIPLKSKNLFDKNNFEVFDGYYIGGGGNFRTASNNYIARISIEPNTTYTISKPLTTNNRLRVGISSHEMTTTESFNIWGGSDTATDVTLTSASDSKYMYIYYAIENEKQLALDTLQVEKGSTVTAYEPYYDIELCKIDTYEDKIYSSDGRFYLNKKIGKVFLNGSEGWFKSSQTSATNFVCSLDTTTINLETSINNMYLNYFINLIGGESLSDKIGAKIYTTAGGKYRYLSLSVDANTITTREEFKNWLSTHNTTVYYILATPTTTEITQENYPSLYNALKQIQDYLTAYKINKEFILGYSSPEIEY